MKRSVPKFLVILAFACFFTVHIQAQARLIGIYNNLTKGTISIPKNAIDNIIGKPWGCVIKLPVDITVRTPNNPTYTIRIEETSAEEAKGFYCPGNTNPVTASILGETTDANKQNVYITNAISKGIIGREVYGFQNVILFIGNKDPESLTQLPFRFVLAAWTSNKSPWDKETISHPADDKKETFEKPLNVFQGQAALGGGIVPRLSHATITHIYNNTPYILFLQRDSIDPTKATKELSKFNIAQLIPPYTAIPFATLWVPKVTTQAALDSIKHSEIRIFAIYTPTKAKKLPPRLKPMQQAGSYELEPSVPDAQDLLNAIENRTPTTISEISGNKTYEKFAKSSTDQYFIGKDYFKIYTNDMTKDKEIWVDQATLEEGATKSIQKLKNSYIGTFPKYFKLTINVDKSGNILPTLKNIPEELNVVN